MGYSSISSTNPDIAGPNQIIWEEKELLKNMELLAHISDIQGEVVRKFGKY